MPYLGDLWVRGHLVFPASCCCMEHIPHIGMSKVFPPSKSIEVKCPPQYCVVSDAGNYFFSAILVYKNEI